MIEVKVQKIFSKIQKRKYKIFFALKKFLFCGIYKYIIYYYILFNNIK